MVSGNVVGRQCWEFVLRGGVGKCGWDLVLRVMLEGGVGRLVWYVVLGGGHGKVLGVGVGKW